MKVLSFTNRAAQLFRDSSIRKSKICGLTSSIKHDAHMRAARNLDRSPRNLDRSPRNSDRAHAVRAKCMVLLA